MQPKREEHCCSEELIDGVALALLVDAIMPLFYPSAIPYVSPSPTFVCTHSFRTSFHNRLSSFSEYLLTEVVSTIGHMSKTNKSICMYVPYGTIPYY